MLILGERGGGDVIETSDYQQVGGAMEGKTESFSLLPLFGHEKTRTRCCGSALDACGPPSREATVAAVVTACQNVTLSR